MNRNRKTFKRGDVTFQMKEEERVYLLSLVKLAKPKTEIQKRILKRAVMKLMGISTHNFPIHPKKECPICEREVFGAHYAQHLERCKAKQASERMMPKIDPVVWEMMQ